MKKIILPFILFTLFSSLVEAQTPKTITEVRETNADGTLVLEGTIVEVTGISIGPNFRPDGLTFVLFDETENIGVTIFTIMGDVGYTVADGDELTVTGEVSQFNGLAEVIPTAITVVSSGNSIPDPEVVNDMDESTESKLVTIHNLTLVDASQWSDSGSFNVDASNGPTTIQIRVDSDTNVSGSTAPTGPFSASGIGGQYDPEAPHDTGYQLFPRNVGDIVAGSVSTQEVYTGNISLFPNPANEMITIEADDRINSITIYNMLGELVLVTETTNSVSVAHLAKGTYIVKVALDEAVWNQALMIGK